MLHLTPTSKTLTLSYSWLHFPALQDLTFDSQELSWPVRSVRSLLARSACALRRLSIISPGIHREEFIALLQEYVFLESLIVDQGLDDSVFSDVFFMRLTSTRVLPRQTEILRNAFLPHLRRLEFAGERTFSWEYVPNIIWDYS